jgi:hypothetical protein
VISGAQQAITNGSASQLAAIEVQPEVTVFIHNTDGTASVFLDGSAAAAANVSYELKAGVIIGPIYVAAGDTIYAITNVSSMRVDVFRTDVV